MAKNVLKNLFDNKIVLPPAAAAISNYVPVVLVGNQAFISGQIPSWKGEIRYRGQLGKDLSVEDGQSAAYLCGLNIIANLQFALGDLDRVKQCVKLNVFVNSAPDFVEQSKVANGVSDLMSLTFGAAGKHARSAVGASQLPFSVAVEVDALFQVE